MTCFKYVLVIVRCPSENISELKKCLSCCNQKLPMIKFFKVFRVLQLISKTFRGAKIREAREIIPKYEKGMRNLSYCLGLLCND